MNFTLNTTGNLPVGVAVKVFPLLGPRRAVFSGTMGNVPLIVTGLEPATRYVARARVNGTDRQVQFTTAPATAGEGAIINAWLPPWNVSSDNVDNLDAIHAARDDCASQGGGRVILPPGVLGVRSAVVGVSRVVIEGVGMHATILRRVVDAATVVAGLTGTNGAGLRNLTLDGYMLHDGSLFANGSHGLAMSGAVGTQNATIENVRIMRCKGYGIGFQDKGPYVNNTVRNVWISDTGSDGIDFKNDANLNFGNVLDTILVERFGQSTAVTERAGIDVRGTGTTLKAVRVREFGLAADGVTPTGATGVRFRPTSLNGIGGEESSLTGFWIEGGDNDQGLGLVVAAGERVAVSNGTIRTVGTGVQVVSAGGIDANRHSLSNVHVAACDNYGYRIFSVGGLDQVDGTTLQGTTAQACGVGYSIAGKRTRLIAPYASDCTTGIQVLAAAADTTVVAAAYSGNGADYTNAGTGTTVV